MDGDVLSHHRVIGIDRLFRITQGSRTNDDGADCVSRGVKKDRPDCGNRYDQFLNKA
jgi:hypothetical protein